jgi:transcriptional regulator with PAS, ATPase and Fis domain
VADLHPSIQAKLLRVLEEKEFYPLGGTKPHKVDIRIISACNRDLWEAIENSEFRRDLYFRLTTVQIQIPALRQRPEDIAPLAHFFIEQFNDKYGKKFSTLTPEAEAILLSHSWSGNVRELRNTIERIVLLENEDSIGEQHLHFLQSGVNSNTAPPAGRFHIQLPENGISLNEIEKEIVLKAYEKCGHNKSKTARYLSIPRHVLIYRLKKFNIED